jgi:hypothetical protein
MNPIPFRLAAAAVLVAVIGASAPPAGAHDADTVGKPRLSSIHFPVSCNAAAQKEFDIAMEAYHSFAWPQVRAAVDRALYADSGCAMAHWLWALRLLDNPYAWPGNLSGQALAEGRVSLDLAREAGLMTDRERDYVAALSAFYAEEATSHQARADAFERALAELARRYPDDHEATILYALVGSANVDPRDKTNAKQLQAARLLAPLFARRPDHPGIAHHLIHSYDFLVYAHLQSGQDRAAQDVIRQAFAIADKPDGFAAAYAYAAMPARHALERGAWGEAAGLALTPAADAYPWSKYPQAEAVNAFARGIGAAKSGMPDRAALELARLQSLRESAAKLRLAYWTEQIDIQAMVVAALVDCARSQREACLEQLREAARREDAMEKHVATPGPVVPARELLAGALMEAGRPVDALREFEAVLASEPGRYRATAGAAKAAELAGRASLAAEYASRLTEPRETADALRAGIGGSAPLAHQR